MRAEFRFSSRFGPAQNAFSWLHELMHFWQDLHGLFFTPLLQQRSATPVMLDAQSHVAVVCFCEAMAHTEALRAAWRLKLSGHPLAWQGACGSLDWRLHARVYARDVQRLSEVEAARAAFDRWYTAPQRSYYERRALAAYKEMLAAYAPLPAATQLRHARISEVLAMLPESSRPPYLTINGAPPP
jgi:hypothetical protein